MATAIEGDALAEDTIGGGLARGATAAVWVGGAGRGGWAATGWGGRMKTEGLRVTLVDAFLSALSSSARMRALRMRDVLPPNTAATTCFPSRRTDDTKLNPDARV